MSSAIRSTLTPKSIKAQLTLWYLLMLGAALAAFALVVVVARQRTLYSEADTALDVRAHYLVGSLQTKLLELDLAGALAADALIAGAPVAVREGSGRMIYRSPAFPTLVGAADSIAVNAARNETPLLTVRDVNGENFRLATIVVKRTGESPVAVQTTASMAPVEQTIWQLGLAMAFWFVLVLAIASYGGAFIAGRALRPVDAIVGRVHTIQASRLSDRLDLQTGSEE